MEKIDDTKKILPATKKQRALVKKILKDFPDTKRMLEYEDYEKEQTIGNASEFISRALEENSDEITERKTYADYIATRPGAERFGSHGLFTTDGVRVDLKNVSDELNAHEGNIWTVIISLRRPDAERLGFNTGTRWRDMLRTQEEALSRELNIPLTNLKWFAAFHNESHHPHVHLIAYSTRKNEGYLTPKGVKNLRSSFAKDIFMQDNLSVYEKQTEYRDRLRSDSRTLIAEIIKKINIGGYENPVLEEKLKTLAYRLSRTSGKKVYGYLKSDVKAIVNTIVDELAKDERISALYDLWYEQKEAVIRTYTEEVPKRVPLSKNTEFKAVRNAVIREAMKIMEAEPLDNSWFAPRGDWGEDEADRPDDDQTEWEEADHSFHTAYSFWKRDSWWTDEYKEARQYLYGSVYQRPDEKKAMLLLEEVASRGNGFAMYNLGTMFLSGRGCEKDEGEANRWFELAYQAFVREEKKTEKKGYLRYRIGRMYALGYGVEQDHTEAAKWYRLAAEERNPFAAYALGSLYLRGQGVEWDMQKAYELFLMAASDTKTPNAYAAYELGRMCRYGIGADPDAEKADEWYRRAFNGFKRIASKMPDDKLYYRIGQMCMNGIGTEVRYDEAEHYLKQAAEVSHVHAMYSLGKLYLKKEYDGYDPEKAVRYLEQAAGKDHASAMYKLGCIYFYGDGMEKDEYKGIFYLTAAAEQGNEYALQALLRIREHQKWSVAVGSVNLLFSISRIIQSRIEDQRKLRTRRRNVDRKLLSRIEEKRQAHGIKQG